MLIMPFLACSFVFWVEGTIISDFSVNNAWGKNIWCPLNFYSFTATHVLFFDSVFFSGQPFSCYISCFIITSLISCRLPSSVRFLMHQQIMHRLQLSALLRLKLMSGWTVLLFVPCFLILELFAVFDWSLWSGPKSSFWYSKLDIWLFLILLFIISHSAHILNSTQLDSYRISSCWRCWSVLSFSLIAVFSWT